MNMPESDGMPFSEAAVDMLLPWLASFLEFGKQFDILGLTEELVSFFWYACNDQILLLNEDETEIGLEGAKRVIAKLEACGVTVEE